MNNYVTGATIKRLREKQNLPQAQLAKKLTVSDKTVSKWETGKGFPDISLIEPLAQVLGVSVLELLSGEAIVNTNRAANLLRSHLYVCPVCGNVLYATGSAMISCCGITLPPLEAEAADAAHTAVCEKIEDELHVSVDHPMTKDHHLTFIAFLNGGRFEFVRLYPEGPAEARFFSRGHGVVFWYCNHHGLFSQKI